MVYKGSWSIVSASYQEVASPHGTFDTFGTTKGVDIIKVLRSKIRLFKLMIINYILPCLIKLYTDRSQRICGARHLLTLSCNDS